MIRKLKSGQYRLYSRKADPKTGKRRNLGTFDSREAPKSTNGRCSSSSTNIERHDGDKKTAETKWSRRFRCRVEVRGLEPLTY